MPRAARTARGIVARPARVGAGSIPPAVPATIVPYAAEAAATQDVSKGLTQNGVGLSARSTVLIVEEHGDDAREGPHKARNAEFSPVGILFPANSITGAAIDNNTLYQDNGRHEIGIGYTPAGGSVTTLKKYSWKLG